MSGDERLTTAQVADLLGIKPRTWSSYVARGQAPAADGRIDGRTPYWLAPTIEEYRTPTVAPERSHDWTVETFRAYLVEAAVAREVGQPIEWVCSGVTVTIRGMSRVNDDLELLLTTDPHAIAVTSALASEVDVSEVWSWDDLWAIVDDAVTDVEQAAAQAVARVETAAAQEKRARAALAAARSLRADALAEIERLGVDSPTSGPWTYVP